MGHIIINYDSLRLTGGFFGKRSFSTWKTKASYRLTSGQTKKSARRQTLQKWCHVMPQEDIRFFKMLHVSTCTILWLPFNFRRVGLFEQQPSENPAWQGFGKEKRCHAAVQPRLVAAELLPARQKTARNGWHFTMTSGIWSPKGQHETNSTTQPHFSYFTQLVQGCRLEGYWTQWTYVLQLGVPCV